MLYWFHLSPLSPKVDAQTKVELNIPQLALTKIAQLGRHAGADPDAKGDPSCWDKKLLIYVSYLKLGSRAHLRALEAFGLLMLEYAT